MRDGIMEKLESKLLVPDQRIPGKSIPWYLTPLPEKVEYLALRLAMPIAAINIVGTFFGFWYYAGQPFELSIPLIGGQLGSFPLYLWPLIADSPIATLLIALSLISWHVGRETYYIHALAFFGCLKLGLWTPFVQLFLNGQGSISFLLYWFLVISHLLMAAEAFLVTRYASFSVKSIAAAASFFLFNDLVDYTSILGAPLHTILRAEITGGSISHSLPVHSQAGLAAFLLTLSALVMSVLIWRKSGE